MRLKTSAVPLLAAAATLVIASSSYAKGKDVVFAIGTPILNLDPGLATDTQAMTARYQVMEPLVQINAETGAIEPLLATSWSVAPDGKTWTFKLRAGVKFHDGTTLTSADVLASLNRIISPQLGLGRSNDLRDIAEVKAVDDLTVQVIAKQPVGDFLQVMALDSASVVSKQSLSQFAPDMAWHPVGTGPFKYAAHAAEQSVTLTRNDAYWGKAPAVEKITFLSVPEASTRLNMLETGEADIVIDVPGSEIDRLQAEPDVALLRKPNTRVAHIGINVTKAPFTDVRVREALGYAIDTDGLIQGVVRGLGVTTKSVISPMVQGYKAQDLYSYDPQKAKALLAEAGFPNGFKTTIWTPQGRYYMDRESVVAIQAELAQVGIDAEVKVIDWSSYLTMLREPADTNKSALYFLAWESGVNDIQYILDTVFDGSQIPPQGWNTMFYDSKAANALIGDIRSEVDPSKRGVLIDKIQHLLMQDMPWVPLYSYVQVTGYRSNLQGIEYLPGDTYRLKNVTFK